jgi:ketosteroid isomerase-like protein
MNEPHPGRNINWQNRSWLDSTAADNKESDVTTAHRLDTDQPELVESFVHNFQDFAAHPTAEKYDQLYHPDGTLWDAGMDCPAPKTRVLDLAAGFLRSIPDLRIAVRRYYARRNTVYLLTDNFGTYQGTPVSWPAVYTYRLREGRIIDGRRFYDQARVLAPINSALAMPSYPPTWTPSLVNTPAAGAGGSVDPADFVRRYDALWHGNNDEVPIGLASCYNNTGMILNPGMLRPITKPEIPGYYEMLLATAPDLDPELQGWAGDSDSLCVEWLYRARAGSDGHHGLLLRVVDIFEFAGGAVQYGHAYFDTLTILSTTDPDIQRQIESARAKFFG